METAVRELMWPALQTPVKFVLLVCLYGEVALRAGQDGAPLPVGIALPAYIAIPT